MIVKWMTSRNLQNPRKLKYLWTTGKTETNSYRCEYTRRASCYTTGKSIIIYDKNSGYSFYSQVGVPKLHTRCAVLSNIFCRGILYFNVYTNWILLIYVFKYFYLLFEWSFLRIFEVRTFIWRIRWRISKIL